jgi:hypothetical protein
MRLVLRLRPVPVLMQGSASAVLLAGYRLKVIRPHTRTVTAQMVDFETVRYRPDHEFVDHTVSGHLAFRREGVESSVALIGPVLSEHPSPMRTLL